MTDPLTALIAFLNWLAQVHGAGAIATEIIAFIPGIVLLATFIGAIVPAPTATASTARVYFYNVIKYLSGSVGHAVNLTDPAVAGTVASPTAVTSPTVATGAIPKVAMNVVSFMIIVFALTACGSVPTATNVATAVSTTISAAQTDVQNAITVWDVAKGLAEVAEPALTIAGQPMAAAGLAALVNTVDPTIQQAQIALNDATLDAAALEALATQIKNQAAALTVTAAPAISVVPNPPNAIAVVPPVVPATTVSTS